MSVRLEALKPILIAGALAVGVLLAAILIFSDGGDESGNSVANGAARSQHQSEQAAKAEASAARSEGRQDTRQLRQSTNETRAQVRKTLHETGGGIKKAERVLRNARHEALVAARKARAAVNSQP